jgi:hypothetical protein
MRTKTTWRRPAHAYVSSTRYQSTRLPFLVLKTVSCDKIFRALSLHLPYSTSTNLGSSGSVMLRKSFALCTVLVLRIAASLLNLNQTGSLIWSDCYNQSIPLKCANLSVPIDWDDPTSAHFNLLITKLPARTQRECEDRQSVLRTRQLRRCPKRRASRDARFLDQQ